MTCSETLLHVLHLPVTPRLEPFTGTKSGLSGLPRFDRVSEA